MLKDIVIDFEINYYDILGITKEDICNDSTIEDKRKNSKKLHEAYRKQAHAFHPDLAPDGKREEFEKQFKLIVKAYTILSDSYLKKIYHGEGVSRNADGTIEIDWGMVGKFRKNSIENEVGSSIFILIDENLSIPHNKFFCPNDEMYHNYIWEIEIEGLPKKLTISLVPDANDVMLLTSSDKIEGNLPFKIYIFFPQTKFSLEREESQFAYDSDGVIVEFPGRIKCMKYIDTELYSGTNINDIIEYIKNGNLEQEILSIYGERK